MVIFGEKRNFTKITQFFTKTTTVGRQQAGSLKCGLNETKTVSIVAQKKRETKRRLMANKSQSGKRRVARLKGPLQIFFVGVADGSVFSVADNDKIKFGQL